MNDSESYRVIIVGNFGQSAGAGPTDEFKLVEAFRELGHTVDTIDREKILDELEDPKMQNKDLVIMFNYPYQLGTIQRVKAVTRCPVVYWTSDLMRYRSENWYPTRITGLSADLGFADLVKEADAFLGDEIYAAPYWAAKGVNFFYFPYKCNSPKYFHPVEGVEKKYDVVFTGSAYPHGGRDVLMQQIGKKFDLHIFSADPTSWITNVGMSEDHCHPGLFDEDFSQLMAQTKISIGISWNYIHPGCWSDRTVKSMLCGAFHLVKYIPYMEHDYQDGVAYFKDTEDCLNKIEYYLKHDDEREAIAKRGMRIAKDRHTITARIKQLLTFLKYNETMIMMDRQIV